ncbi:TBCD protein [Mycena floridula]|nr:TBCD protein [Mycena floridula]
MSTQEDKLFATFDKHAELVESQNSFLSLDLNVEPTSEEDKQETQLLRKMTNILDHYQEQSFLLDPFLESLVVPVVDCLKSHAKSSVSDKVSPSPARIERLSLLLYGYIKCRGYKTITRFFPHEIADLSIAVEYMLMKSTLVREPAQWALRYSVLLWLALICMIPFDLAQFDEIEGHTAMSLESLAKEFLGRAGLEREGAAFLLSRLYMRKDMMSRFEDFLVWAKELLLGPFDPFMADDVSSLGSNTIVRKFRTKLASRIALRMLPGPLLSLGAVPEPMQEEISIDVPEEVEMILEKLLSTLQDKDTVVRWSSAKGVARVAERLPSDFADQVLETVMALFDIHSITAASMYDLPAIAEGTWHGACLACAEMARRSLVAPNRLQELLDWLSKALYFDLRKGAHSIGSNVRDSAAYVLWALARTQAISDLAPHAENLARRLVTVAIYDREIHIRRAASAAFQEYVGRTNLFPHGIDTLGKTDFYAVGIRRNSFLVAAPQVAEHSEYRMFLFDHIINVTLRHWDITMRELGAQSLRLICLQDMSGLGPQAIARTAILLESVDLTDLHGGLLALTEISVAYRESGLHGDVLEEKMQEIFKQLARARPATLIAPRNELVTAAACGLIATTITLTEINLQQKSAFPDWRKVVDCGIKHRKDTVQDAGVAAMAEISNTLIRELGSSFALQPSLGKLLGVVDYNTFPKCLPASIECLLECVGPMSKMKANVEARRNCYNAFPLMISNLVHCLPDHLAADRVDSIFGALVDGLSDYTTDERGDVGSWIRIACIRGLTSIAILLMSHADSFPNFETYLSPSRYHMAVGGILKQGLERLDHVRQEAGEALMKLLHTAPTVLDARWTLHQSLFFKELFPNEPDGIRWHDGAWLFPKAIQLLRIQEYRKDVLSGVILSLGSRTDSTHRSLATSLIAYSQTLPTAADAGGYNLFQLASDVIQHAKSNLTSNSVVIPALQTFNVLLEADALKRLSDDSTVKPLETLMSIAIRNVDRLKNIQRILASMKAVVNLLSFHLLYDDCVKSLPDFLAHQFPTIRSETAEYLYLTLQSKDIGRETDEVEEILLETEWAAADRNLCMAAAQQVVSLCQA